MNLLLIPAAVMVVVMLLLSSINNSNFISADAKNPYSTQKPTLNDPDLRIVEVSRGLDFPTSMAFLDKDDILVLEKNSGMIKRIIDGKILEKPLLDVNVVNAHESGLLGIAVTRSNEKNIQKIYVFLYFTEAPERDTDNKDRIPIGNRLYKYELVDNKLIDPKILLNLTASSKPWHNGGKVIVGPDDNLYLTLGDRDSIIDSGTKASNIVGGKEPNGSGGVLRITQDGKAVGEGIIGSSYPLNLYYGYGIRNSFGIDFDPVTGNLWDTENGPLFGDEINLVKPGFNGGWNKVQGIWEPILETKLNDFIAGDVNLTPDLVTFEGKGQYSAPELIWNNTAGLSALKFLDSNELGEQYKNDLFVGDVNNGNLYHFDLKKNRLQLDLDGVLADKIADKPNELQNIIFGKGFDLITDIAVGPDGYLYILTLKNQFENTQGTIFKVVPA